MKSFVLNSEENLDLIETLWNVKTLFAMNGSRGMGFNRDIVECKVNVSCCILGMDHEDLIETLWNVKSDALPRESARLCDLIETLWNVKHLA